MCTKKEAPFDRNDFWDGYTESFISIIFALEKDLTLQIQKQLLGGCSFHFKTSADVQIVFIVTAYFLQISWHDMNFELTLRYFLINEVD